MASQKQRNAARRNVRKAQRGARQKTITKLSKSTRRSLGREGAKAAARKRGASKGTGSGAGAMTVTELRREAAKLGIEGPLEDGQGIADPRGRSETPLPLSRLFQGYNWL